MNKNLVLIGILFASILAVENLVTGYQAFVFIWTTKAWLLAVTSVVTGILIGYGLRGMLSSKKGANDDEYDF